MGAVLDRARLAVRSVPLDAARADVERELGEREARRVLRESRHLVKPIPPRCPACRKFVNTAGPCPHCNYLGGWH